MCWQDFGRAGLCGGWFRGRNGPIPEVVGYHGIMMAIKIDKQIQT